MNTPWGTSDSKQSFGRGISFVGTPSHGGFAISRGVAEIRLSPEARARAIVKHEYFFFEEDCDADIVMLELPETRGAISLVSILQGLSRWHADYLLARGYEPDADGLKFFNENRLQDRMRTDKSPDLIVSASGSWHAECPKGEVLVTTASGDRWLVHESEYDNRKTLNLLSGYSEVKAVR